MTGGGGPGEWYDRLAARVDAYLDGVLPPADAPPRRLHEAMRYAVLGGGKRLRPVLVLAACRAVGGRLEDALPAAAAVELVHAYSLVHDDLPAMDDDRFRRGRPTVHTVFGEALAILTGDALLTLAFAHLARALPPRCGPEVTAAVLAELGEAAGSGGLVGGQVEDLAAEGQEPDLAALERIHAAKTGALFVFCARAGGRIGGASSEALEALAAFGRQFGLAFQIADDVLDAAGDVRRTGKLAGRDRARGKVTYATLLGVEEARARAREAAARAKAALAGFGEAADWLRQLADFAAEREH